eukprot:CAMPEP_0169169020 /NCGR_PEP_ID=MMETSP1015-20121227/61300_1 /TAXON_ID=342587 /ORGANISM="Karlodinium micrum, Strain CCMP2283" /LENGTH=59 /DNA_ID=CAMNT_0009241805 /DNA_START=41 /DNA_END=216 /DNA_ORIENTATION=+
MMFKTYFTLACLLSFACGRRVQSANEYLTSLRSDGEQEEKIEPSSQSFVEVKASWSPAS